MKKLFFALLVILLTCPAFADAGSGYGGEFLKLVGGARPLAMGNAYTALGGDSSSIFFNPACLARLSCPDIMAMENQHFAGITQYTGSFAVPTDIGVFGGGYSNVFSGNIEGYDSTGAYTSDFDTSSIGFSLAYARRFNKYVSLGFGAKIVSERLEENSASTIAIDAGTCYELNPNVVFGLSILNVGSGLKFIAEETPLPTTCRAGVSWVTSVFDSEIDLAADIVADTDGTILCAGAEYWINNMFALRGGFKGAQPKAGIGLSSGLCEFDYAYMPQNDLGATQQFSISFFFGAPQRESGTGSARPAQNVKEEQPKERTAPAVDREASIKDHMDLAAKRIGSREYDKALEEVNSALSIDPENQGAKELKKKLELILNVERK